MEGMLVEVTGKRVEEPYKPLVLPENVFGATGSMLSVEEGAQKARARRAYENQMIRRMENDEMGWNEDL